MWDWYPRLRTSLVLWPVWTQGKHFLLGHLAKSMHLFKHADFILWVNTGTVPKNSSLLVTYSQQSHLILIVVKRLIPQHSYNPSTRKRGTSLAKGTSPLRHSGSGTYAVETCTSCQLLDRFCFSSPKGERPSLLFSSPQCLSLAARTWRRVPISSSTCKRSRAGDLAQLVECLLCIYEAELESQHHKKIKM